MTVEFWWGCPACIGAPGGIGLNEDFEIRLFVDGVEVLRRLRQCEYSGGVIIITGSHDAERLDEAWALGPQEVIGKPIDLDQLLMSIQLVLVCREC